MRGQTILFHYVEMMSCIWPEELISVFTGFQRLDRRTSWQSDY
jgi:hypothetical protein